LGYDDGVGAEEVEDEAEEADEEAVYDEAAEAVKKGFLLLFWFCWYRSCQFVGQGLFFLFFLGVLLAMLSVFFFYCKRLFLVILCNPGPQYLLASSSCFTGFGFSKISLVLAHRCCKLGKYQ
jgi:hypothetical protein